MQAKSLRREVRRGQGPASLLQLAQLVPERSLKRELRRGALFPVSAGCLSPEKIPTPVRYIEQFYR